MVDQHTGCLEDVQQPIRGGGFTALIFGERAQRECVTAAVEATQNRRLKSR